MADPYLLCPDHWRRTTLEPDHADDVIVGVDSGGTPSTSVDDYWDGDIPWLTPKDMGDFQGKTQECVTPLAIGNGTRPVGWMAEVLAARHRKVARGAAALLVRGRLERSPEGVVNIIAEHLAPLTVAASVPSRDFH